jgi:hypothetical protein
MEEGIEKTRKQKLEIRNWKLQTGNLIFQFLISRF